MCYLPEGKNTNAQEAPNETKPNAAGAAAQMPSRTRNAKNDYYLSAARYCTVQKTTIYLSAACTKPQEIDCVLSSRLLPRPVATTTSAAPATIATAAATAAAAGTSRNGGGSTSPLYRRQKIPSTTSRATNCTRGRMKLSV